MIKHLARTLLGAALGYAGITHLSTNRKEFLAQVPTCGFDRNAELLSLT